MDYSHYLSQKYWPTSTILTIRAEVHQPLAGPGKDHMELMRTNENNRIIEGG